nr:hypothetical protein [Desulfonatronum thioautotrophicum]
MDSDQNPPEGVHAQSDEKLLAFGIRVLNGQGKWITKRLFAGEDMDGTPTVRFMPVQKYGMSKCVEPFLREQYLCIYPAEPGIEEHYKRFLAKYHDYLQKEFN